MPKLCRKWNGRKWKARMRTKNMFLALNIFLIQGFKPEPVKGLTLLHVSSLLLQVGKGPVTQKRWNL